MKNLNKLIEEWATSFERLRPLHLISVKLRLLHWAEWKKNNANKAIAITPNASIIYLGLPLIISTFDHALWSA